MTGGAVKRALAATNGGPGLTAEELAEQLGESVASVRLHLARLVYGDREVTCRGLDGRYKLGEPPPDWPSPSKMENRLGAGV